MAVTIQQPTAENPSANIKPLHALSHKLFDEELSKKPKLAYDIGANEGGYSRIISAKARKVHAFEPVPNQFAKLKELTKVECKNVVAFNLGMSDAPGAIKNVGVFHAWTLLQDGPQNDFSLGYDNQSRFDMKLTTIDEHASLYGAPDFIKLDVDGYELRVLKGAIETLKKKPASIYFEYSYMPERFLGDSIDEMCNLIYSLGYRAWALDGEYVAETPEIMLAHYPKHTSFDIMLIHRDRK